MPLSYPPAPPFPSLHHRRQKAALGRRPDVVVSTPSCIAACLNEGVIRAEEMREGLKMVVLDEVRAPSLVNGAFSSAERGVCLRGRANKRTCAHRLQHVV